MASPAYGNGPRRVEDHKIALTHVPQVFALKKPQDGLPVGEFGSVMYTAVDERKLFVAGDDASDFHHTMVDLRIQPAEFIRVSRVKHGGRGGGFSIRVERLDDDPRVESKFHSKPQGDPPSRIEAQLEKSVAMARQHGAAAFVTPAQPKPAVTPAPAPPATSQGTMTGIVAGALMASIDAYLLAVDYATSKGIKVNLELDFNAEDVRQSATAMCIQSWRDGGTR